MKISMENLFFYHFLSDLPGPLLFHTATENNTIFLQQFFRCRESPEGAHGKRFCQLNILNLNERIVYWKIWKLSYPGKWYSYYTWTKIVLLILRLLAFLRPHSKITIQSNKSRPNNLANSASWGDHMFSCQGVHIEEVLLV